MREQSEIRNELSRHIVGAILRWQQQHEMIRSSLREAIADAILAYMHPSLNEEYEGEAIERSWVDYVFVEVKRTLVPKEGRQ